MEEKVAQISEPLLKKQLKRCFNHKVIVFKIAKRSLNIWATFVRKFVAKEFQKSKNLVTLAETSPVVGRNEADEVWSVGDPVQIFEAARTHRQRLQVRQLFTQDSTNEFN